MDSRHPAFGDITAVRAVVIGRVQGVGFRYSTEYEARRLGVAGWVRNRMDGSVETWVQGADDAVTQFVTYLETGPKAARVTSVEITEVEPDPGMHSFEVRF
jgi:acylphosphatase